MESLTPLQPSRHASRILYCAVFLLSALALFLAAIAFWRSTFTAHLPGENTDTAWKRTISTRTLHVGVGAFPPYTMINPSTNDPAKRYTGFTIDMVHHIANSFDPPLAIEFHEINWDTLRADMYSGKCDFLANVMYITIPRLTDFDFTTPFTYMSVGVGIVSKDDNRFVNFEDLNRPDVRISLVQGWTPTDLARSRLPKATLQIRPMDNPAALQYEELAAGRADIILQDAATAELIRKSHPDKVKLLWRQNPPMRVAAGFMLRKGDDELRHFLSQAIETMLVDGTIDALDRKWAGLTDIMEYKYRPGTGVRPPDNER